VNLDPSKTKYILITVHIYQGPTKLDISIVCQQDILAFDVAMDHLVLVQVAETLGRGISLTLTSSTQPATDRQLMVK